MKYLFLLCVFGFTSTSYAQAPVMGPKKLYCGKAFSLYNNTGFELREKELISQIAGEVPRLNHGLEGTLVISKNNGRSVYDFSDGDQVLTYTFISQDLQNLNLGSVKSIKGLREDGYFWIDGYTVRSLFVISCEAT